MSSVDLQGKETVAALIDHTLLKPDATQGDIVRLCAEARQWSFASVCLNPCWVRLAVGELSGTPVRVCTVIGFPLGANETRIKITEADTALAGGARELDMVQNIGALRSQDYHRVYKEIADLADIAHASSAILKVILETSLLTEEEKEKACRLAVDAKADFVKTSTGFSTAGATVEDVALMRRIVGDQVGVKASGGVRTLESLRNMVGAGASRIGTSSGVSIIGELENSIVENAPGQPAGVRGGAGSY